MFIDATTGAVKDKLQVHLQYHVMQLSQELLMYVILSIDVGCVENSSIG